MAIRYDLRSQQDLDGGSYAALPGSGSGVVIPHNTTPMKSSLAPGREIRGCHPSRWIYELVHNSFTECDIFERARQAKLETPLDWQHPHKLVINGKQSYSTTSSRVLSSVCLDCHFHFVIKMAWDENHEEDMCHPVKAHWPLTDDRFPWHHLVWAGSESDLNISKEQSKYYPLLVRENFVCCAPPCTFQLTLEVSEPRMPSSWITLLQDHKAILEQLRISKEQEPVRYEAATDDWATQGPLNLNTYLKNLLDTTNAEDVRSISKRNKRFAVLFGQRCSVIFKQLEFEEKTMEEDGIDEGSFTPPFPGPPSGPSGTTELNTYRGFLEDVRAEVQCLIHKAKQAVEGPTFCTPVLHEDLRCQEIPGVADNALINIERYKLLGVLPNQPKEVIVNAYKRQWELMPNKRRDIIEALMGIANDTNDEQLSDFAITQSSVFESQLQRQGTSDDDGLVSQALIFLGLQPPNNYSADALVQAFRQKLAREPADAATARSMLLLIAQSSTDDTYQATLLMEADAKMSLATSKVVLGLVGMSGFGHEALEAAKAKVESSSSKDEKATYLDAMEAIADHTNSIDLKWTVNEMRQNNQIAAPGGNSNMTGPGKPVDYELPVGLENIGNTCYLNSLLQYLFTVKPVRDIALNYESFKLELTDENIKERLLGGNKMQMDRGEAVVSQAFAQELSKLFNNLQNSNELATRPSQRLANAVLLSTHTLLNDSKQASESSTTSKPPPLPARPSPAAPTESIEDVDMLTSFNMPVPDSFETASSVSSQTLVDQGDEDSDRSYEKVDIMPPEPEPQMVDLVAELGEGEVAMHDAQPTTRTSEPMTTVAGVDPTDDIVKQSVDVDMSDAVEPETVDQKVLNALEHQKRSSGTDQQDVEEVMGSILNRLQAAIRPSAIDKPTGIQLEKIMETFFVTTINYTKKFDDNTYQEEISFDRSITAFPASEGACSLYDALGRNFDQQIIEESKLSRYTSIKTLPPVLHVLIQRSQSMGSKNGNPVVIPETLYLDRYMDAPHDSPVFRKRVEHWMIANRISDIKTQKAKVEADPPSGPFLESYGQISIGGAPSATAIPTETEDALDQLWTSEEIWDFDGPVEDDFLLVNPPKYEEVLTPAQPLEPERTIEVEKEVREMMDKELRHRERTLQNYHDGLQKNPYRLHAVICHRGQLMSGHYWVWIHDFEKDVWHKYNDSNVEANRSTEEVLKTLSTSGEPYFLCYVREEDKDVYVDVPKRQVPASPAAETIAQAETLLVSTIDAEGDGALYLGNGSPKESADLEAEHKMD
ncbi:hypothetical protein G7046_g6591 [Stylonectria norvegica]|nr:hypothetical protein G7046_g6591 [Stylonectria norvegica]